MRAIVVIGGLWGDVGKGKMVDNLAQKCNLVVRFSGGDNAGHTVINPQGEFKLHLIPSGIFAPGVRSIIGNGCAVNPRVLIGEIEELNAKGVDTSRLCISNRAHLIMPWHTTLDGQEETLRAGQALGTTGKGIGPAFADKVARTGLRAGELLDKPVLKAHIEEILYFKNLVLTRIFDLEPISADAVYAEFCGYADRLAPYICETVGLVNDALDRGEMLMLEGAQGTLLDTDFGTYPFCTSSPAIAAGGCVGAGIGINRINEVYGVFKAYCTRVGAGPFPTELHDADGERIRERAHEFGTTTGRPRRCGWFDAVAARYSQRINGFTGAFITRLDILDMFDQIKICTSYRLDGKLINYFPANIHELERCEPVYEEMPGWGEDIGSVREFENLPLNAQRYVRRLEELMGCPAAIVSVGPAREQTITVRDICGQQ